MVVGGHIGHDGSLIWLGGSMDVYGGGGGGGRGEREKDRERERERECALSLAAAIPAIPGSPAIQTSISSMQ